MKDNKRLVLVVLGVCVVLVGWYIATAEEPANNNSLNSYSPRVITASSREVLSGLKGVYVIVEDIGPEVEKKGLLTTDRIKTIVELELKKSGVNVLSEWESLQESGAPALHIEAAFLVKSYDLFSGTVIFTFRERVRLIRQPGWLVKGATTWSTGTAFRNCKADDVQDIIKEKVDTFINDYLAANPKEQVSVKDTLGSNNN